MSIKTKNNMEQTFEQFVKSLDRKQGNYRATTEEKNKAIREDRINRHSDYFEAVVEHLVSLGYNTFIYEKLTPKGKNEPFKRFTHIYIPEINTSIRIFHDGEQAGYKLREYLYQTHNYIYTCVLYDGTDMEWLDNKLEEIKGYYMKDHRLGVENDIIKPKRKRVHIPFVEKITR